MRTIRVKWTPQQEDLIQFGATMLGNRTIYSVVKQLMTEPIMKGRSWESIRCKLNRHRRLTRSQ